MGVRNPKIKSTMDKTSGDRRSYLYREGLICIENSETSKYCLQVRPLGLRLIALKFTIFLKTGSVLSLWGPILGTSLQINTVLSFNIEFYIALSLSKNI